MTSPSIRILLARLSNALGNSSQTTQEFKWMKDHASGDLSALHGMVQRRINREPLQYILGTQPFGPLELKVRRPVLIPRPETEDWTLRLARILSASSSSSPPKSMIRFHQEKNEPLRVLDLCTGTGCIPLLLCHMWARSQTRSRSRSLYHQKHQKQGHDRKLNITNENGNDDNDGGGGNIRALGVDIADEAIELANENAERYFKLQLKHKHKLTSHTTQSRLSQDDNDNSSNSNAKNNIDISFLKANILHADFPRILKELGWTDVDVLTSNPPYIPQHEYERLSSSVRDFEDPRALLGDPPELLDIDHHPTHTHEQSQHQQTTEGGKAKIKDEFSHHHPAHTHTHGRGQGLTFYHQIASLISHSQHALVRPGGIIALEVGHDQSAQVAEIMRSVALVRETEVWTDPWGVPRTVVCTK